MNKKTAKSRANLESSFEVSARNCETTLSGRIASIAGENVSAFAKKAAIGESLLRQYIAGSTPGLAKAAAMAEAAEVSLDWLATGKGESRADQVTEQGTRKQGGANEDPAEHRVTSDFVLVPRYDVQASAGHGALVQNEQIVDYLAFRKSWIDRENLQGDELALIQARGDSMSPAVESGDLLLVDLREQAATDDGIYVLSVDNHLVAKRLQRMVGGEVYIKSDNAAYETQILLKDQLEDLNVVGRVVWVSRRV